MAEFYDVAVNAVEQAAQTATEVSQEVLPTPATEAFVPQPVETATNIITPVLTPVVEKAGVPEGIAKDVMYLAIGGIAGAGITKAVGKVKKIYNDLKNPQGQQPAQTQVKTVKKLKLRLPFGFEEVQVIETPVTQQQVQAATPPAEQPAQSATPAAPQETEQPK